jgi:hypothetical protein
MFLRICQKVLVEGRWPFIYHLEKSTPSRPTGPSKSQRRGGAWSLLPKGIPLVRSGFSPGLSYAIVGAFRPGTLRREC